MQESRPGHEPLPRGLWMQTRWNSWFYCTLFAFALLLALALRQQPLLPVEDAFLLGGLWWLYLGVALALMWPENWDRLRAWLLVNPSGFGWCMGGHAALTLMYQGLVLGFEPTSVVAGLAYAAAPVLLVRQAQKNNEQCGIYDILLLLALWAPLHSGFIRLIYGPGLVGPFGTFPYVLAGSVALVVATVGVRQFEDVGWDLTPSLYRTTWLATASVFGLGAFTLLGARLALGFGVPTFDVAGLPAVFLLGALPAELMFRGLLLNILEKTSGSTIVAVGASSLIYGAAHIGPVATGGEFLMPMLMATLLGLICGLTYLRTASVLHSALVHTLLTVVVIPPTVG